MTRVLFLDDMEARVNIFRTKFPDLVWCDNSKNAIKLLASEPFDLICLDYDLDLTSPFDFGMRVVDWVCYEANYLDIGMIGSARFIVHSANLLMGTEMVQGLSVADTMPSTFRSPPKLEARSTNERTRTNRKTSF